MNKREENNTPYQRHDATLFKIPSAFSLNPPALAHQGEFWNLYKFN